MIINKAKDPPGERWLGSLRARRLLFALLAVLGSAAIVFSVYALFRTPTPPVDDRVFSEAPAEQLPLSKEPLAGGQQEANVPLASEGQENAVGSPPSGTQIEANGPVSPIDQLFSNEPPPSNFAPPALQSVSKLPVKTFWVQLGAYSSLAKAEEGKALVQQEFDAGDSIKIKEVTISQQKFYRLRMGPYPSKEEAQRIMELVRSVKPFRESYILIE